MGNQSQDQHQGSNSSISWSPDEESTFLDMLVEEFINKQPEAMDALVALVLFRISKITDEGWKRVAKRLSERTGKKYTITELKEQLERFTQCFRCIENLFGHGGSGMNVPRTTFEPYFESENDTMVYRSPDENVPTPERVATNSDRCSVSVPHSEDFVRNSNNRRSGKVSYQEGDTGMDFSGTAFEQSFEHESDSGISTSPDENFSVPEKEGRNSDESNFNVPYREGNVRNFDRRCDNLSYPESGPGPDFPCATFERDKDAGFCWSPDVHQEDLPGISQSPIEKIPIPEKECSVPYPDGSVGNSSRSYNNVSYQGGGPATSIPRSKFEPSDDDEIDTRICPSPVGRVSMPGNDSRDSDLCNGSMQFRKERVRNSSRSCGDVLHPQEDVVDSGENPNVPYPRKCENSTKGSRSSTSDAEKNCRSSRECENGSSPLVYVESISQWFDSASGQEEKATSSTPYKDHDTKESMGRNKHPAADPLDSSYYKRNKWSSYSQVDSTRGVDQNPDDGDSFSVARCRNILQGMRRIDRQFRDTALDFLEDPYYRKFFMQMKHDKRLDWLNSILGTEH